MAGYFLIFKNLSFFFPALQMLKHVHLSPYRSSMMSHHGGGAGGGGSGGGGRSDTLSLNSTMSCSSLSNQDPLSSRSSSYTSLNESSHHLHQHPPSPMVRQSFLFYRQLNIIAHSIRVRSNLFRSSAASITPHAKKVSRPSF